MLEDLQKYLTFKIEFWIHSNLFPEILSKSVELTDRNDQKWT